MSADIVPSILETNVFTALRAFILGLVACEVVRAQGNRVPMPVGDFIALTQTGTQLLSTNTHTYDVNSETILSPTQFTIQVDCYGANSQARAKTIATLLRDDYGCQALAASGFDISPLYAGDAHQMPLVDGELQYEERWTFECVLQINPTITVTTETADTLSIDVLNVDRTYPP